MQRKLFQFIDSQTLFTNRAFNLVNALVQDVVNVAQLLFDGGQSPLNFCPNIFSNGGHGQTYRSITMRLIIHRVQRERAGLFTDLVGGVIPAPMAIALFSFDVTRRALSLEPSLSQNLCV